jgi:hypothetical protein
MYVFGTLAEAIAAGYMVYDRTEDGYLVRTRIGNNFGLARVVIRTAK